MIILPALTIASINAVNWIALAGITVNAVNWTALAGLTVVMIGIVVSILKIFGSTHINETKLRSSEYIKEIKKKTEEEQKEIENLRERINEAKNELSAMRVSIDNCTTITNEIKQDYKKLVDKMENLIKQIIELQH